MFILLTFAVKAHSDVNVMMDFSCYSAMEATNLIIGDEIDPQNEAYNSGHDELMMEKLNKAYNIVTQNEGPNDSTKTVELAAESTIADSSSDKDGEVSTLQEEFIGLTLHKVQNCQIDIMLPFP